MGSRAAATTTDISILVHLFRRHGNQQSTCSVLAVRDDMANVKWDSTSIYFVQIWYLWARQSPRAARYLRSASITEIPKCVDATGATDRAANWGIEVDRAHLVFGHFRYTSCTRVLWGGGTQRERDARTEEPDRPITCSVHVWITQYLEYYATSELAPGILRMWTANSLHLGR